MTERPIIMSAASVRAILAGAKTQSRRVVKPQPSITNDHDASWYDIKSDFWRNAEQYARDCCPYGVPGEDRLWVRETWCQVPDGEYLYRADMTDRQIDEEKRVRRICGDLKDFPMSVPWKSPIFMPRAASRITLEIESVRIERLQSISEEDARAEGIVDCGNGAFDGGGTAMGPNARQAYMRLWDALNRRKAPWASDPWIWRIEFRRLA